MEVVQEGVSVGLLFTVAASYPSPKRSASSVSCRDGRTLIVHGSKTLNLSIEPEDAD